MSHFIIAHLPPLLVKMLDGSYIVARVVSLIQNYHLQNPSIRDFDVFPKYASHQPPKENRLFEIHVHVLSQSETSWNQVQNKRIYIGIY
jgi:hypothetical protein